MSLPYPTGSSVFSSTITWSGGGSANANTAYTHSQAAHLALGTTSGTAHRGDHGVTAYTYSQVGHLPLAGGTLTGGLTGTTGTFSGILSSNSHLIVANGYSIKGGNSQQQIINFYGGRIQGLTWAIIHVILLNSHLEI